MLIDIFKEMTSHQEGYCIAKGINEIRLYFTNKITKFKKKVQNLLKEISNQKKCSLIFVTLPSSKKKKNAWHETLLISVEFSIGLTF